PRQGQPRARDHPAEDPHSESVLGRAGESVDAPSARLLVPTLRVGTHCPRRSASPPRNPDGTGALAQAPQGATRSVAAMRSHAERGTEGCCYLAAISNRNTSQFAVPVKNARPSGVSAAHLATSDAAPRSRLSTSWAVSTFHSFTVKSSQVVTASLPSDDS